MPEYLMTIAKMPRRRITKLSEIMTEARYMTTWNITNVLMKLLFTYFFASIL